jgi:VanZ family protein
MSTGDARMTDAGAFSPDRGIVRVLWLWGPALLVMLGIFFVSDLQNLGPLPGDVSDHSAHFAAYAVLGACVLRATAAARWDAVSPRAAWQAWIVAAVYGATDEFHQRFVPGRTSAVDDWIADAAGAAVAILIVTVAALSERRHPREV